VLATVGFAGGTAATGLLEAVEILASSTPPAPAASRPTPRTMTTPRIKVSRACPVDHGWATRLINYGMWDSNDT
jgi:hypothetical protein